MYTCCVCRGNSGEIARTFNEMQGVEWRIVVDILVGNKGRDTCADT